MQFRGSVLILSKLVAYQIYPTVKLLETVILVSVNLDTIKY